MEREVEREVAVGRMKTRRPGFLGLPWKGSRSALPHQDMFIKTELMGQIVQFQSAEASNRTREVPQHATNDHQTSEQAETQSQTPEQTVARSLVTGGSLEQDQARVGGPVD